MTTSIPLSQLESTPSAKFPEIGSAHKGRVTAMDQRDQTDTNGNVKQFKDGTPRKQWVISLEKNDGEVVSLYASGGKFTPATGTGHSMQTAIGIAVREAGADSLDIGGELAVAHTGLGEAKPGQNAPKLYTAQYRPPSQSVPVGLFDE